MTRPISDSAPAHCPASRKGAGPARRRLAAVVAPVAAAIFMAAFAGAAWTAPSLAAPSLPAHAAVPAAAPALAASSVAPGRDDSEPVDTEPFDSGPFGFVARLNVQGAGQCSAALIAPTLAITAAHCLRHPTSGRMVAADRLHLLFGYEKGRWLAHRQATGYRAASADVPAGALADDWAVIRFETPVTEAAPLAVRDRAPDRTLQSGDGPVFSAAGYGAPRREVLTVRRDCTLRATVGSVLRLGCALSGGASGGPVIDQAGRLAGVMVAVTGEGKTGEGATDEDATRAGLAAMIDARRLGVAVDALLSRAPEASRP
jgi:protease YdgD